MTQELFDKLSEEFWLTAGVMTFSQIGTKKVTDSISWKISDENPDPKLMIGEGDPNDPTSVVDASWPKSRIDDAATDDGWLREWLTHAWLAMMFARWEAHYRPAFAAANTVDEKQVRSDVIGDIRHLRNDVIHHQGIATAKNAGKCKVYTKFVEGDRIILQPEDIRMLRAALKVEIAPETAA